MMRSFVRACLIIFATLFLATGANATWTAVQTAQNKTGSGTSCAITVSALGTGNVVVGYFFYTTSTTNVITGISDGTNTYTVVDFQSVGVSNGTFWFNGKVTGGPTTITLTASVSQGAFWCGADEFTPSAGTVALDKHSISGNNVAGTTADPGSVTTTVNGDLVYGTVTNNGGTVAGSGFTLRQAGSNFNSEWQQQGTAGAIDATFTQTSAVWGAGSLAISLTPSGGTNTGPIRLPLLGVGGD